MNIKNGTIRYKYNHRDFTLTFRPGYIAKLPGLEVATELLHLDHGWRIVVKLIPEGPLSVSEAQLEANYRFVRDDRIFCNGLQSRTESREFTPGERMKKLPRSSFRYNAQCPGDYHFFQYTGGKGHLHSHGYCYIKQKTGQFSLLGSTNEHTGYTIYACETKKNTIRIIKDIEGLAISAPIVLFDLMLLQGLQHEVIPLYFNTLCPGLQTRDIATGWKSWHRYYRDISEDIVLDNLAAFTRNSLPVDIFQIDDGYEAAVGDWLDIKPSFPNGMKHMADRIKSTGRKAGLWIAPFICEESSNLMKNHPGWLLRKDGNPVPAGWNQHWNGAFYALDIYNDELLYYLREVMDTIFTQWGFELLTVDHLYASAMNPRDGKTRGMIMTDAMNFLRRCAGDKLLKAGGVPLCHAFGLVDYCRISSDSAPKWEDRLLSAINFRERPSVSNSIAGTIGRSHLNGRVFVNDPDAFLLGDENSTLTPDQRRTRFFLNNIFGGLIFTSDSVSMYQPETMRLFRAMFPFRKKENVITTQSDDLVKTTFSIGEYSYIAYCNLSARRAKAVLDKGLYFCPDLDEENLFSPGETDLALRPYESRCYLAVRDDFFTVSGTTSHIFPGSEITSCVQKGDTIAVNQHEQAKNKNTVYIRTPGTGQYHVNGVPLQSHKVRENLFVMKIEL